MADFAELVAEGEQEPVEGWDFSFFTGRASEARPSWGYVKLLADKLSKARAALDVQTGGGEVYAEALQKATTRPALLCATESWAPNAKIASARLGAFDVEVREVGDDAAFPFGDGRFDLVVSRHPTSTNWQEIERVLRAGGTYFSQQVGPGSNRELTNFLMGAQRVSERRDPRHLVALAQSLGLELVDFRTETLPVEFFDIGAVVYFLRKVPWTVPEFSVERYRDRLQDLHLVIETEGSFRCFSRRFLLEMRKP